MPQGLLDFICGFLMMPTIGITMFAVMWVFGSWKGSPFDHPLWVAGMFIWIPLLFISLSFVKVK